MNQALHKHTAVSWLAAGVLALTLLPGVGAARATPSVAEPFVAYYNAHEGMRVLGYPLSDLLEVQGYAAQYFEKGRIEDHSSEAKDPRWAFMYGRLTAELIQRDPQGSVSGTNMTYQDIQHAADPKLRTAPPPGFTGGSKGVLDAMFVPFDAQLRPAPGYAVAPYFWAYINRADLFPGGWLHDVGLPMTQTFNAQVTKNGVLRNILVQAFERAVLTYDMQNPAGWQMEKGNIGADAMRSLDPAHTVAGKGIEIPAEGARVMLPLHILAYTGKPGEEVVAQLRWQDGTTLSNTFTVLAATVPGHESTGVIASNLDWINMLTPPDPRTQPATLELRATAGSILSQRQLTVVSQKDSNTQEIKVYWSVSGTEIVQPQTRRVLKSERIASTAIEELLWGPPVISQVGFGSSLPTPEQVLNYPGRQPDWGPRVTLLGITQENGVATADFSKEMRAYGGGSLRVKLIHDQITMTLKQFSSVRDVRIAIEGETEGVLEP